ncbi:MAG: 50S ribosomal protein L21 [Rhizobiaceae bacterium]|nr:50S ribosomal protein L21 [Rhizobiaceae bacterium]
MFAVVKTGGKQYRVVAEDVLKIEKVAGEAGDFVELSDVLMVGEGGNITAGAPLVEGACVSAEIVSQGRTRKIIAFKKRRRQNSRRTIGHRQHLTTVRIAEILTDGKKPSKKAAPKKAAPAKEEKAAAPAKEAKKEAPKKEAAPKKEEAKAAPEGPLFTAPEGDADKLTDIKGIGPVAEKQLNEQGITTFAQIAGLSEADIEKVDEYMPFSADQIKDWQAQAKEKIA